MSQELSSITAKRTWLGPPPELVEEEPLPQQWQIGADVNPPWQWNARERVLIVSMECYLKRLTQEDNAISVLSFAANACDEGGRKTFRVLETERGIEVAKMRRFLRVLQESQDRNCRELQDAIEHLEKKRSGFLEAMERKQRLRIGAPEEVQASIFKGVVRLDHKV